MAAHWKDRLEIGQEAVRIGANLILSENRRREVGPEKGSLTQETEETTCERSRGTGWGGVIVNVGEKTNDRDFQELLQATKGIWYLSLRL